MFGRMAALAVAPVLAFAVNAQAQDHSFALSNDTSLVMVELYVSPSGSDSWEEDLLGDQDIQPGESGTVTISGDSDECSYDILGVFEDGTEVENTEVDLCTLESYSFTEE